MTAFEALLGHFVFEALCYPLEEESPLINVSNSNSNNNNSSNRYLIMYTNNIIGYDHMLYTTLSRKDQTKRII
jgi:hypothetical protein